MREVLKKSCKPKISGCTKNFYTFYTALTPTFPPLQKRQVDVASCVGVGVEVVVLVGLQA